MKTHDAAVGVFIVFGVLLFSIGLFFIGDRHKAFNHHVDFYTELADVNGVAPGTKVRVAGFDAGEVKSLGIPSRPSEKFRMKLHVDGRLHELIREDSFVTVESDGLVGDKFLQIHDGTDRSAQAADGATLPGKEPVELSAVIAKATVMIDQANGMLQDVHGKLDTALDTATATIGNMNGLIADARHGRGAVGVLLNDQQTAAQLKQTVANAELASNHINQITVQAGQFVTDVQSRNLPAKLDDTITTGRNAVGQLNQASTKVNATLNDALGPDRSGETAAENVRESLSNVNLATAHLADDTEALKHEFFFRGFFKKRGFYSLQELTPAEYRTNAFFQSKGNRRFWLSASADFTRDSQGRELLTSAGEQEINQMVKEVGDAMIDRPLVVEGYSSASAPGDELVESRSRSLAVTRYVEKRYGLKPQNVGEIPLNTTPPPSSGRSSWDGACIVVIAEKK